MSFISRIWINAVCLLLLAGSNTYSQEKVRTIDHTQHRKYDIKTEPIAIVGREVSGKLFLNESQVRAETDWLRELTLTVKNISTRPIKQFEILLRIPKQGKMSYDAAILLRFPVSEPELDADGNPTGKYQPPRVLKPDEGVRLKVSGDQLRMLDNVKADGVDDVDLVFLAIGNVSFDDGTRWYQGLEMRQDPNLPDHWFPISPGVPTVVQRGQYTNKEREYSKDYRKLYGENSRHITFTELINKANSMGKTTEEIGRVSPSPCTPDDPDAPKITSTEYLRILSCKADAIVFGTVKNKITHITDDEEYAYSEYPFSVAEVLKDDPRSSVQVKDMLEVTRPGGIMELDGRRIRVEDQTYPFLQINRQYVLFLKFLPSTNGYVVAESAVDFVVDGTSYERVGSGFVNSVFSRKGDSATLLAMLRNAVSAGCGISSNEHK